MKNKRFEEYFREYKDLIIRQVMDKTGDYQAAQEICQQVFFKLYLNMDRVHPEMVKAWLMRCAKHAISDYFRKKKLKNEFFVETSVSDEGNLLVEESVEIYEEKRETEELTGRILKEVREANEKWYEILVLSCIEGMSYSEMAKKLNVPAGVLRARMYRARMFIRDRFGDEYLNND